MHTAAHADDPSPLSPAALAGVDPARVGEVTLAFEPSLSLVSSPWPIDRIWRANQPDADGTVDLDTEGVRLEVRRLGEDVVFRRLTEATFAFRRALLDRECLATGAERALAVDAAFDLGLALGALVHDGVLTGITGP